MAGPIEVVVFDMGGVACRFEPDRRAAALAQLTGRTAAEVDRAIFGSGLDERAERGELTPDQAYDAEVAALGGDLTRDQLRQAMAEALDPDLEVLDLVRLVARPTALFTNNGPVVSDCLAHELAEVAEAFDHLVLSWELGTDKPHRAAYQRAAERLGADPGAVLFFDDSGKNVDGAREAGWDAHRFEGVADAEAVLSDRDLLAPR